MNSYCRFITGSVVEVIASFCPQSEQFDIAGSN